MKVNNLACHAAGYVVNGPEMFVWQILGSHYVSTGKVEPVTKEELVEAILSYEHNRFSKKELEKAVDNLAGSGRNGPIQLTPLLTMIHDKTLLPTEHFGIRQD